ncbi:MAG: hypothetical protein IT381_07490 [Deltaproteobacteria bacterium]|nr:hypothetical protein [Deltaproteobacteria bacterium]
MDFAKFREWLIQNGIKEERHLAYYDRVARELVALTSDGWLLPKHIDQYLQKLQQNGGTAKDFQSAQKVAQSVMLFEKKQAKAAEAAAAQAAAQPPKPGDPKPPPDPLASPAEPEGGLKVTVPQLVGGVLVLVVLIVVAMRAVREPAPPPAAPASLPVAENSMEAEMRDRAARRGTVSENDPIARMCAQSLAQMGADDITIRIECYNDKEAEKQLAAADEAERKQRNDKPAAAIKSIKALLIASQDPTQRERTSVDVFVVLLDGEQKSAASTGKAVMSWETAGRKQERLVEIAPHMFHPMKIKETGEKVSAAHLGLPVEFSLAEHKSSFFSIDVRFEDRLSATAQVQIH